MFKRDKLLSIYNRLYKSYGPQYWWPADSRFEVMIGAILTQNTAWTNVEKAINNLKQHNQLSAKKILKLESNNLAELIRPSGYFNLKARRLKNFSIWYETSGGGKVLDQLDTGELRERLLGVNGIGPETADDILLYAFERPVFVIDAYTRKLFKKLGYIDGNETYEKLRGSFESNLDPNVDLYNEYHALIVRHAKQKCSSLDNCKHCFIEKN